MNTARALVLVAVGGAAGTAVRVGVSSVFPEQALASTLAINTVGAFLLGVLLESLTGDAGGDAAGDGHRAAAEYRNWRRRQAWRLLLGTGFCGGFTTYSLVAMQTAFLARDGDAGRALTYAAATLVLGGLATLAGILLAGMRHSRGGQAADS